MTKDVDMMRDNGGKYEYHDLSHPERSDLSNPYGERRINKENRDDYKDTIYDPDLKDAKDIKMNIISSYNELKKMFEINNFLEIIPANKMDYHPFLKEGYYGFNDKTPRNFIFSVENVDDKNCAIDCYVVGQYDFNEKERCGFRCGKSLSCTWYLTVGEKYYYNINRYPNEKYVPFIMESVNLIPFFEDIKKASKDVDMMRDTGGTYKHKDLQKPSRSDRKNNGLSEKDPDSKDTCRDPDMKLSHIALKLAKQFIAYEYQDPILTTFYENKQHFQKSLIYDIYGDGHVVVNSLDDSIKEKNLGAHNVVIQKAFKFPQLLGWDEDGNPELKQHNKHPRDFFNYSSKKDITKIYKNEELIEKSKHDKNDRWFRNFFIDDVVTRTNVDFVGYDQKDKKYIVIYDTGIVDILGDDNTKITSLIAAPNQLTKFYKLPKYEGWDKKNDKPILINNHHEKPSRQMLQMSKYYEKNKWNYNELPKNKVERDYHKDELIRIRNSKIAKELIKLAKSLIAYDSKILQFSYELKIDDLNNLIIANENNKQLPELEDLLNRKNTPICMDYKKCLDFYNDEIIDGEGKKFELRPNNPNFFDIFGNPKNTGKPYFSLKKIQSIIKNFTPDNVRRWNRGRSNWGFTVHIDDKQAQELILSLTTKNFEKTSFQQPICDVYKIQPYIWQGYVIDDKQEKKLQTREKDLYIKIGVILQSETKKEVVLVVSFHL